MKPHAALAILLCFILNVSEGSNRKRCFNQVTNFWEKIAQEKDAQDAHVDISLWGSGYEFTDLIDLGETKKVFISNKAPLANKLCQCGWLPAGDPRLPLRRVRLFVDEFTDKADLLHSMQYHIDKENELAPRSEAEILDRYVEGFKKQPPPIWFVELTSTNPEVLTLLIKVFKRAFEEVPACRFIIASPNDNDFLKAVRTIAKDTLLEVTLP